MSGKDINSLFNDRKLAAITFSTAEAAFAIPLEQVLYIEKDVQRNLKVDELDEFNHGVITLQYCATIRFQQASRYRKSPTNHEKTGR
jgi:hypothetical protein